MGRGGSRLAAAPYAVLAVLTVLTVFPALMAAQDKALTKAIDRRLDAPPFDKQLWGVALIDAGGKLVYGRNAQRMFMPASNTKLVVSAVAAALLPGDFSVKTSVYAAGPVRDGTVEGDLVLYGRGDPTFGNHCYDVDTTKTGVCDRDVLAKFRALAQGLAARGVRVVRGSLVGDGSWFGGDLTNPNWERYDLNWWYAAPVSGLGVNDNSVDLRFMPGARAGMPAQISALPAFADITLDNRSRTVAAGGRESIDFDREPGTRRLIAFGDVPLGSNGSTEYFALPDPDLYAAFALRTALADEGIAVLGATVSTTDSLRYAAARTGEALAEVTSRPLRDWIFPILNTSQNWFADMLLKQLGRRYGPAGTWADGVQVERRFLIDSVRVDSTEIALTDGSGLAANNLVSPHAFTQILRFIRRHPGWTTFEGGLPRSGATGSLRTRFINSPIAGQVRAKTGSISRVNTLSGFVELSGGRYLTFSVMANHHAQPSRAMLAQIDSVVTEFARLMEKR